MSRRLLVPAAIAVLLFATPTPANNPAVYVEATGFGANTVEVSVHNLDAEPTTLRVTVNVELATGAAQTLTSSNLTVGAWEIASVTLTAAQTIVAIGDDPDPIPPSP